MNSKKEQLLNNGELLRLYDISVREHHYYVDTLQKRIDFFTGIISALIVGTFFGLSAAKSWGHYVIILMAPILAFTIAEIGIKSFQRINKFIYESISVRVKYEQLLKISKLETGSEEGIYWPDETIVPPEYLEKRRKWKSSEEFINFYKGRRYYKWIMKFYRVVQVISVLIVAGLIYLAIEIAMNPPA